MSSPETNIDTSVWAEADEAFKEQATGYIEFCIAVAKKDHFQKLIARRYQMSQPAVARAVVIGKSDPKIIQNLNNPKDKAALYDIANAHTKHGDKVLEWLSDHPQPTHKVVKAFIEELEPRKNEEKPAEQIGPKKSALKVEHTTEHAPESSRTANVHVQDVADEAQYLLPDGGYEELYCAGNKIEQICDEWFSEEREPETEEIKRVSDRMAEVMELVQEALRKFDRDFKSRSNRASEALDGEGSKDGNP